MAAPSDSEYRAFVLDNEDNVVSRHDFTASSTASALETARQWVDGHDVEVWLRTHIVARLKHDTDRTATEQLVVDTIHRVQADQYWLDEVRREQEERAEKRKPK